MALDSEIIPIAPPRPANTPLLRPFDADRFHQAENLLWQALRNKQLEGLKFKRQVPLEGFIADFVCFEARLIVEVDGGQHSESRRDGICDRHFETQGFSTLRVWNEEILGNFDGICLTILHKAMGRLGEGDRYSLL